MIRDHRLLPSHVKRERDEVEGADVAKIKPPPAVAQAVKNKRRAGS